MKPLPARAPWRRVLRGAVSAGFVTATAVATALTVRSLDWTQAAHAFDSGDLGHVAGALLANSAGMVLAMLSWHALLSGLGGRVPLAAGTRIYFAGIMTKFLPGRFWPLVVNIRMGRTAGVGPGRMATAYVLSTVTMLLAGLGVGLVAAPVLGGWQTAGLVLAGLPLVVCAAKPDVANRWAMAAAQLLRREPPRAPASSRAIRLAIAAQTLSWLVSGLHLWLLSVAAGADPARSLPICVGTFGIAAVVGAVVMIAPDGLGVREGIALAALYTVLPLPAAGAVVVASRLACTLSEIITAGAALAAAEAVRRLPATPRPAASDGHRLDIEHSIDPHEEEKQCASPHLPSR